MLTLSFFFLTFYGCSDLILLLSLLDFLLVISGILDGCFGFLCLVLSIFGWELEKGK